jgi:preprotein translocase subunit SecA
VVIPTNKPTVRKDRRQVFLNRNAKYNAVLEDIKDCQARPAGAGGHHVDRNSELLSEHLRKAGVPHEVLNAKQHEREAQIVARPAARRDHHRHQHGRPRHRHRAGRRWRPSGRHGRRRQRRAEGSGQGRMAEAPRRVGRRRPAHHRHRAPRIRRIDNQLRGRSGRQGDPGSSRFYLSLEDNLMRIFASDRVQKAMRLMGMKEDDAIEDRMVSRQIEKAQRKVEAHNFDIRKNLLEYDDVANDQRKVIYQQRNELLDAESVKDNVDGIREDVVTTWSPASCRRTRWTSSGICRAWRPCWRRIWRWTSIWWACTRRRKSWTPRASSPTQQAEAAMFAQKEEMVGSETARALEST